jgi:hypothetical protein
MFMVPSSHALRATFLRVAATREEQRRETRRLGI